MVYTGEFNRDGAKAGIGDPISNSVEIQPGGNKETSSILADQKRPRI